MDQPRDTDARLFPDGHRTDVAPYSVHESPDPVKWITVGDDRPDTAVRLAGKLRVVNAGTHAARLYIDGVLFGYATLDGFTVHTGRRTGHNPKMPGVTLTIAASRVEFVDDIDDETAGPGLDVPARPLVDHMPRDETPDGKLHGGGDLAAAIVARADADPAPWPAVPPPAVDLDALRAYTDKAAAVLADPAPPPGMTGVLTEADVARIYDVPPDLIARRDPPPAPPADAPRAAWTAAVDDQTPAVALDTMLPVVDTTPPTTGRILAKAHTPECGHPIGVACDCPSVPIEQPRYRTPMSGAVPRPPTVDAHNNGEVDGG